MLLPNVYVAWSVESGLGPFGPILMFSQMLSEVFNSFVYSRASFAVVPPIFVYC